MNSYSGERVAARAGVEPSYVVRLVDLGILVPDGTEHLRVLCTHTGRKKGLRLKIGR